VLSFFTKNKGCLPSVGKKLQKYGQYLKESNFNILEVGCGAGYFLQCVEDWYPEAKILAGDFDRALIQFAKKHTKRAILLQLDAHKLPFENKCFDVIVSLQVIEHLKRPEKFLEEVNYCLKEKGLFLFATPNPSGIPAKLLGKKWQGYRCDHISLRTPPEWRELFNKLGFEILEDGTTGLTGFKILQKFPFVLINWIPMAIFGFFPWQKGESYMAVARKG
jgi:SAM-dependent methyltransferase